MKGFCCHRITPWTTRTTTSAFTAYRCRLGKESIFLPEPSIWPRVTFWRYFYILAKFTFRPTPVQRLKSTGKPYLSKSTDTLQWKLLHYKLQVTNSKTTWVKFVEYLILTVLKYFTYSKYRPKDALVKETCQSKTVTLGKIMCRQFMEKLEQTISQKSKCTKNRMAAKQTTITLNNSQRTKETLWLYIYIYICSPATLLSTPVQLLGNTNC